MRLEYFLLIDRIVELKLDDHTIRTEATVPTSSTIFEGHFPGSSADAGRAPDRDDGADFRLASDRDAQIHPHAVLCRREGGEAAHLRHAGPEARGLGASWCTTVRGLPVTKAEIRCEGKAVCNAELTFRLVEFPNPVIPRQHGKCRRGDRIPHGSACPWLRRARSGSPASGSSAASARASRRIGRACPSLRAPIPPPSRPMSCTAPCRSISTSRSRRRAISARWRRGSATASTRRGSRSRARA